jgi:hypothetical protein
MTRRLPGARLFLARSLAASVEKSREEGLKKVIKCLPPSLVTKIPCSCLEMASIVTLPFELTAPPAEWTKPSTQGKISGRPPSPSPC